MAGIHLNSTVWTGSRLPDYIADVVVLFSKVLFIYLFNLRRFEPNHSADYRGPLMAEGGVRIWFLFTGWCNCGALDALSHTCVVLIGYLKPRRWRGWRGMSGMKCFLKRLKRSFLVVADEQTLVAETWVLAYFSAILLHKSSIWEKMRCVAVPRSVTLY